MLNIHGTCRLFPKADGVIVVRERIVGLQLGESPQSLERFFWRVPLDNLHLPQEQIRSRIAGSEIGRVHETLRSLIVGTASVPSYAERDQHTHGLWKQTIAFRENLGGRFQRAMSQKLGLPIEQVRFAGIKLRRALVFPNGLQWMAQLLLGGA